MPKCAICAEKQKKTYQLCHSCIGEEKKTCLKCYSKMLFMCDEKSSCTAIHLRCAFCRQGMIESHMMTECNYFTESFYYVKKANELRIEQLMNVQFDRDNLLNTIENLGRMLTVYDRRRSRNLQDMLQERRDLRAQLESENVQHLHTVYSIHV